MKNRCLLVVIVSALFILALPGVCFSQLQHSLGIDFIRLFDRNQYKGMLNLSYQVSVYEGGAVTAGIARGDDAVLFDVGYKFYLENCFEGPFAGVGIVTGRIDGDSEFGVTAAAGYEMSLERHMVVSGAVEVTTGSMDNPGTGHRDLIFRPILSLVYAF